VNDPSIDCADLIAAYQTQSGPAYDCFVGCQSSGTGGAGGAGGSAGVGGAGGDGGGSSNADCSNCGQTDCQAAGLQCFQQFGMAECQNWISCAGACGDAACVDACTVSYPGGALIEQCLCTSCSTECMDFCN
jgi:hypothetical protein